MTYAIPRRRAFMLVAAGLAGALTTRSTAWAADSTQPLVRVRSASRSLPMMVAVANGFFADEELQVDYGLFVSSRPTFIQVDQREIEVIISSADNAINYQLNPGNPAGRILDNVIVAGHDLGLGLTLAAAPGFPTAADLRGHRVGVDVPHSGFSLLAEKIMLDNGLVSDRDYTLQPAGSTPARFQGLLDGRWEAAILNAEGVVRARDAGLPMIGVVDDTIHPYVGGMLAANRGWLRDNPDVAVHFLRAFIRAMDWIYQPGHRDEAIGLLVDQDTTPELAAKIYDLNVAPDGLARGAALSQPGLRNLLALRDEFHGFESPQDIDRLASPQGGLYDLSFLQQAALSPGRLNG